MTSKIIVFAGPSLQANHRPQSDRLEWRDPAATGDVLRAALEDRPGGLCLIDGYFDHRPAPWHKEMLVALELGIAVFGASSMGALRAAELDIYGMVGVGEIYRAYRSGLLSGDDEVALIHAPGELDWACLSVPMVEVRATLATMVRRSRLPVAIARASRDVARAIHYVDRDWPTLKKAWIDNGLSEEMASLVEHSHVPLKRLDAQLCVDRALAWVSHFRMGQEVPRTRFLVDLEHEIGIQAKTSSMSATSGSPKPRRKGR